MKYITAVDYLMGRTTVDKLSSEQTTNLETLIIRINDLLSHYNRDIKINSGYRSPEDQARINPKAPKSNHLICAAVDIADRDHCFRYWVLMHLDLLIKLGLWMEDPSHTATWVHLQCIPPRSGSRIFIP